MYMIRLINRWKRIYEYGASFGEHDSHNLIETNLNGEEKYVKTDSIFNINGINKGKRDISIRIDEYFLDNLTASLNNKRILLSSSFFVKNIQ